MLDDNIYNMLKISLFSQYKKNIDKIQLNMKN